MENRRFSGALVHYLCIFNGKIIYVAQFILQYQTLVSTRLLRISVSTNEFLKMR